MDSRKVTKDFINYICDWVEHEYKSKGHEGFRYELKDKEAYMVADKGIENRIQKQLSKRLDMELKIKYELDVFPTFIGTLRIRLIKKEPIPELCFPFNRRY